MELAFAANDPNQLFEFDRENDQFLPITNFQEFIDRKELKSGGVPIANRRRTGKKSPLIKKGYKTDGEAMSKILEDGKQKNKNTEAGKGRNRNKTAKNNV